MSATKKYFIVYFSLLSLLSLAAFTAQSLDDNDVEDESDEGESNPLLDLASGFLQNSLAGKGDGGGLAAIGGMLGTLMQGNGAKNLGDALAGMQGKRNNPTGDVLSSLGSLFTNNEGNLDPSLLGSVISAFAGSVGGNEEEEEVIKPVKKTQLKQQPPKQKKKQQKPQEGLDLSAILNVASAFMGNMGQNKKKSGSGPTGNVMEDLAGALPLIMSTISSFTGPEAEERAHKHADHAWFLPPLVEKLHVFWDHFISSDLGKTVWQNAGLSELTKTFTDENGRIDFEVILKSLENHSFRRRWIKRATTYLAEWATHVANPEVQQRYLASSQFVVNGFLSSQGFPKHIVFNPAKFSESTSTIVNYVLKKYLNTPTDVSVYIKPAVKYVNDILQTAQSHGSYLRTANKHELSDKLTDTLNLEIIEPVLRVYRAYRFAHKAPHCQTHVLCVINRHDPDEKLGLPGFKAGLTKFSSLVASAALSYQGGHGFWDLYNAIQEDSNCQARYPAVCDEFHEEEVNVTTEYYHNEL